MPKYLLLKHYRGGPEQHRPFPPMDQWAPEDVEAHFAFLKRVSEVLEENGELVGVQGLTPAHQAREHPRDEGAQRTLVQPLHRQSAHGAADMTSRTSIHSYIGSPPGPGSEET